MFPHSHFQLNYEQRETKFIKMARERKQVEHFKPEVKEPVKRAKKAVKPKAKTSKSSKKSDKEAKPKKANAFMMFSNANRADVLKKNPKATFGETGKIIGELWKALKESEKADWKKKVRKLM